MAHRLRVLYLHGFASGPGSRKARFFAEKLSAVGVPLQVPDLAAGDFENLTISGQLSVISKAMESEAAEVDLETVLIGSSLGGYLASLYAAAHPETVARVLLLAPAFRFVELWKERLGESGIERWEQDEKLPIFHYGLGRDAALSFRLMRDAAGFPPEPSFHQPTLVFHGRQDEVVPAKISQSFAARHANVKLVEMDSGHELTDVLEAIWTASESFIRGPA